MAPIRCVPPTAMRRNRRARVPRAHDEPVRCIHEQRHGAPVARRERHAHAQSQSAYSVSSPARSAACD
eukprot:scaffold106464_cov68-Phaeocystis_antarctica.AAC.3